MFFLIGISCSLSLKLLSLAENIQRVVLVFGGRANVDEIKVILLLVVVGGGEDVLLHLILRPTNRSILGALHLAEIDATNLLILINEAQVHFLARTLAIGDFQLPFFRYFSVFFWYFLNGLIFTHLHD